MPRPTAPAITVIHAQDEPPSRRAWPRSRAPSARETAAAQAIIRPILADVEKKNTVVAKPTPAVTSTSPSHEM